MQWDECDLCGYHHKGKCPESGLRKLIRQRLKEVEAIKPATRNEDEDIERQARIQELRYLLEQKAPDNEETTG